jgi:SAM-dependent methyltransferase
MPDVSYILGHSESEMRRLMLQAAILRPITERLLRETGLVAGMRVLDLGCGTGDVAMLAAALVGPNGAVVGIDRSAEVLAIARERAGAAGYANIEFHEGAAESFIDPAPFDLAIGRYVLIHQADPAAFIRAAASHVRPGGIIAFHEIALYGECPSLPPVPLWSQTWRWIVAAFESGLAHPDAAGRMIAHFRDAGLKQPTMFCEIPIAGGPDSPLYAWAALTVRSLISPLEQCGAAAAVELGIDTLADRLREAVSTAQAQALALKQFCGWLKL